MTVFAFAQVPEPEARHKVYNEIKKGFSRFGTWEQEKSLKEEYFGANRMLLEIKPGDWIVHVNSPEYDQCIAVKVKSEYGYDEGIDCSWGKDFNNYFEVDIDSIIEFDRRNPNILPPVNLKPRPRIQRVLQTEDFFKSIENLKDEKYSEVPNSERSVTHLKDKVSEILPQLTQQIHEMNKGKELEKFLHEVFKRMPNTTSIQNGFGRGTDHGADLIVDFENPIIGDVNVKTKLIVQVKSYEGPHFDTKAIDQIIEGIKEYDGDAGLLITTAEETEEIENYITEKSEEIGKTIDLIAGADVARFVLRYAPDLVL